MQRVLSIVAAYNDLDRIWKSLTFRKVQAAAEIQEAKGSGKRPIPGLLLSVDLLAQRYGVSPREVLDWPYEMFLTMSDMLEAQLENARLAQVKADLAQRGIAPELADIPGVEFSPARGIH